MQNLGFALSSKRDNRKYTFERSWVASWEQNVNRVFYV